MLSLWHFAPSHHRQCMHATHSLVRPKSALVHPSCLGGRVGALTWKICNCSPPTYNYPIWPVQLRTSPATEGAEAVNPHYPECTGCGLKLK
jgi:hypothetical protein